MREISVHCCKPLSQGMLCYAAIAATTLANDSFLSSNDLFNLILFQSSNVLCSLSNHTGFPSVPNLTCFFLSWSLCTHSSPVMENSRYSPLFPMASDWSLFIFQLKCNPREPLRQQHLSLASWSHSIEHPRCAANGLPTCHIDPTQGVGSSRCQLRAASSI